eukprot:CAMPEP_0114576958 /NCGR_PEP_ID=MMETSP0125-20121206/1675_1 /TAXON_ID=485358 ORGANISM="Aristerostoma sp., Strain ATCC 50986" /NCGR_SAMPLE_ID=MMETSP0125 /ASSEMBLY_ACC=CAM_ASM_000245 /LENGTH=183 /DNA_ID=CAMNT_0001765903 /DNA_START=2390 /DNA_END=2941 /DNA_ORIENTATION=+
MAEDLVVSGTISLTFFGEDGEEIQVNDINGNFEYEYIVQNSTELWDNGVECKFWNYKTSKWSSDGCEIETLNENAGGAFRVKCACSHLTDSSVGAEITEVFSNSGLSHLNNFDGFANFSFSKCKIAFVLIFLFISMLMFSVWGRSKDKQDVLESGANSTKMGKTVDIGLKDILKGTAFSTNIN